MQVRPAARGLDEGRALRRRQASGVVENLGGVARHLDLAPELADNAARSTRNVARSIPMYVLPYMFFSTQTPSARAS